MRVFIIKDDLDDVFYEGVRCWFSERLGDPGLEGKAREALETMERQRNFIYTELECASARKVLQEHCPR